MTDRPARGHGGGVHPAPLVPPPPADLEPAFAAMFRAHHDFVWRILRRFGVPEVALDDKVQDVFLVVYRRWSDLDPSTPPRSWLYGIARRVAADQHRGDRRRERRLAAVPEPPPLPPPDAHLAEGEAAAFLEAFLATLDEDKRAVFVLADLEGLSAPEIAAAVGANLNTVYSRLRLARQRFAAAVAARTRDPRSPR